MNFDLYLKTRRTFPTPEGPAVIELRLGNDCLADFETLLAGVSAEASSLVASRDTLGLRAWVPNFILESGTELRCAITKDWFPEQQVIEHTLALSEVFKGALSICQELKEDASKEEAYERFTEQDIPELIRSHFELSSILLDDEYELPKTSIDKENFFSQLFEVSSIIDTINYIVKPAHEEALRIYCAENFSDLDFLCCLNPKKFFDNVLIWDSEKEYVTTCVCEDIPDSIEDFVDWTAAYSYYSAHDSNVVKDGETIYDFTNI